MKNKVNKKDINGLKILNKNFNNIEDFKKFYDLNIITIVKKYSEIEVFYYYVSNNKLKEAEYIYGHIYNKFNVTLDRPIHSIKDNVLYCVNIFLNICTSENYNKVVWICELLKKHNQLKFLADNSIKKGRDSLSPIYYAFSMAIDSNNFAILNYLLTLLLDNENIFNNKRYGCYLLIFRRFRNIDNNFEYEQYISLIDFVLNQEHKKQIFYNILWQLLKSVFTSKYKLDSLLHSFSFFNFFLMCARLFI